jgi:hypothetical protein
LQRKRERSQLLLDVSSQAVSNLQLRDFLRAISAIIRRAMQCNCASLSLPDTQNNQLQLWTLDFPEYTRLHQPLQAGQRPVADSPRKHQTSPQVEQILGNHSQNRTSLDRKRWQISSIIFAHILGNCA